MRSDDLPELPGYLTVHAVAKKFGIHKESVFYKIYEQKVFKHVYRIGSAEENQRAVIVLLEDEVNEVFKTEKSMVRPPNFPKLLGEWNARAKQWARDTGWDVANGVSIKVSGPAPRKLVKAYLEEHPGDPRPEPNPAATPEVPPA